MCCLTNVRSLFLVRLKSFCHFPQSAGMLHIPVVIEIKPYSNNKHTLSLTGLRVTMVVVLFVVD